ncbi:MAG TPA: hypothetical protein VND98_05335 [Solirubrobacterales bacterium]|nr:hypothetical protein [Solirubrobacterales bacterium]
MVLLKRRSVVAAVAGIGILAIAAAAFAYFSSTGSGTATATVGSSSNLTLHGNVESSLYPGSSSTVTFTVDNPSSGSEHLGSISLSSITPDAGHSACSTVISGGNPDFTMAPVTVNQTISPGNGKAVAPTGTLTMNDTGVNQDACQGATLTLHLSSN